MRQSKGPFNAFTICWHMWTSQIEDVPLSLSVAAIGRKLCELDNDKGPEVRRSPGYISDGITPTCI